MACKTFSGVIAYGIAVVIMMPVKVEELHVDSHDHILSLFMVAQQ